MRVFESPDGTRWGVELTLPGSSNALLIFHHSDGRSARRDRYAWYLSQGPGARSVTSKLDGKAALDGLDDRELARLYRRSMPVSAVRSLVGAAAGRGEPPPTA
ncbi:MAG: hypothetical protein ACRENI_00475 [Gemmatimonadaceae bacterium]